MNIFIKTKSKKHANFLFEKIFKKFNKKYNILYNSNTQYQYGIYIDNFNEYEYIKSFIKNDISFNIEQRILFHYDSSFIGSESELLHHLQIKHKSNKKFLREIKLIMLIG